MESLQQAPQAQADSLFEIQIDQQNTSYLSEIARWAKFLSIVGFIVTGLFTLFFLLSLLTGSSSTSVSGPLAGSFQMGYLFGKTIVSIMFIVILIICFFPCLYMFRFSNQMQIALRNNDQGYLTSSFGNLKSYFKFTGILTIVIISLYILFFTVAIIVAARYR